MLGELYPIHAHDLGGSFPPDFEALSEKPVNVPVLVIEGKQSLYSSEEDVEAIARHYNADLVSFEDSGDFPFIEEPEKFSKVLATFLVKNFGK